MVHFKTINSTQREEVRTGNGFYYFQPNLIILGQPWGWRGGDSKKEKEKLRNGKEERGEIRRKNVNEKDDCQCKMNKRNKKDRKDKKVEKDRKETKTGGESSSQRRSETLDNIVRV